jgi:hypothetical protein
LFDEKNLKDTYGDVKPDGAPKGYDSLKVDDIEFKKMSEDDKKKMEEYGSQVMTQYLTNVIFLLILGSQRG